MKYEQPLMLMADGSRRFELHDDNGEPKREKE